MYQSVQKPWGQTQRTYSPMRCFRKGRIADDLDLLTSICLVAPDAAEVGGDLRPTPLSFRTMAEGMLGRDLLLTPPPPVIPLRSSTLWCEGLWLARLRGWVWGVLGVGPDGPVSKEQMFATGTYFLLMRICLPVELPDETTEVFGEVGADPVLETCISWRMLIIPKSKGLGTVPEDIPEDPDDSAEPTGES